MQASKFTVKTLSRVISKSENTTPLAAEPHASDKPHASDNPHHRLRELTDELHRLEENLGAANVELTPDDLREIDVVASKINVKGERYPESAQRMINR